MITRLPPLAALLACACADPGADSFAPRALTPALDEIEAPAGCPTLTIADLRPGDIVITEFMADAYSSDQEWIELHNRLPCEVSLSGARLETQTFDLLGRAAVIPARGYLTLSYLDRAEGLGFEPDVSMVSINFHTSSSSIVLRTSTMVIDSVAFDWSDWLIQAFEARSLSLNRADTHARANDFAANWCHADRSYGAGWDGDYYGTPGAPNRTCTGTLTDFDADGWEHEWAGGGDCDDERSRVNPDALERCSDGMDNDCDGLQDCEDDGCYGIPPCEGCDDGTDEDGDGLIDCDDSDCADDPACLELDCSDGVDDDGDGLVDCEDGDCADSALCVELDCSDGLDSDTDGLVDCDDDDCWGAACHPGGARARVLGGSFQRTRAQTRSSFDHLTTHGARCGFGRDWNSESSMVANGAFGTVQVLPDGVSSWSATTARTTCTWSAASTVVTRDYWSRTREDSSGRGFLRWGLSRGAVNLASGCRLASSSFLPSELFYRDQVFWADYDVIYNSMWLGTLREPWFMLKTTTSAASSQVSSSTITCGSRQATTWHSSWQGSLGSSATSGMYAAGW